MPNIIKNGIVIDDDWKTVTLTGDDTPETIKLPEASTLTPHGAATPGTVKVDSAPAASMRMLPLPVSAT